MCFLVELVHELSIQWAQSGITELTSVFMDPMFPAASQHWLLWYELERSPITSDTPSAKSKTPSPPAVLNQYVYNACHWMISSSHDQVATSYGHICLLNVELPVRIDFVVALTGPTNSWTCDGLAFYRLILAT